MTQSFELAILINAPTSVVWDSLIRTERMKEWMGDPEMGIEIETDWNVGRPIVVRGFHYSRFENTGAVLEFKPMARLSYTHLSSLSRLPDEPGSFTTLKFSLNPLGDATSLTLVVTGFPTVTIFKHVNGGAVFGEFGRFENRHLLRPFSSERILSTSCSSGLWLQACDRNPRRSH